MTERNQAHRYRICVAGKGLKSVFATADSLDDVAKWISENCEFTLVAQGVEVARKGSWEIEIRDRDATYTDSDDGSSRFGVAAESRSLTRRAVGHNPRLDD